MTGFRRDDSRVQSAENRWIQMRFCVDFRKIDFGIAFEDERPCPRHLGIEIKKGC
jgi:hypothetical protein